MSQKLDLNFIQQSPFSLASCNWLGVGLLLAGFMLGFITWKMYQSKQATFSDIEEKLLALDSQSGHEKIPSQIINTDIPEVIKKQIKTTVSSLTTPWASLLLGIEASDMEDIALLSIEPNVLKQQVGLSGEAKNLEAVLVYIQKLEAQSMLDKVYLQKHNVDETDPSKPVGFTLLAQWQNVVKPQSDMQSKSHAEVQINEKD